MYSRFDLCVNVFLISIPAVHPNRQDLGLEQFFSNQATTHNKSFKRYLREQAYTIRVEASHVRLKFDMFEELKNSDEKDDNGVPSR